MESKEKVYVVIRKCVTFLVSFFLFFDPIMVPSDAWGQFKLPSPSTPIKAGKGAAGSSGSKDGSTIEDEYRDCSKEIGKTTTVEGKEKISKNVDHRCITDNVSIYLKKSGIQVGPDGRVLAAGEGTQFALESIRSSSEKLAWVTMILDLISRDIGSTCISSRLAQLAGIFGLGDLAIMLAGDIDIRKLQYKFWSKELNREARKNKSIYELQREAVTYLKEEIKMLRVLDLAKMSSAALQLALHSLSLAFAAYETVRWYVFGDPSHACIVPKNTTKG